MHRTSTTVTKGERTVIQFDMQHQWTPPENFPRLCRMLRSIRKAQKQKGHHREEHPWMRFGNWIEQKERHKKRTPVCRISKELRKKKGPTGRTGQHPHTSSKANPPPPCQDWVIFALLPPSLDVVAVSQAPVFSKAPRRSSFSKQSSQAPAAKAHGIQMGGGLGQSCRGFGLTSHPTASLSSRGFTQGRDKWQGFQTNVAFQSRKFHRD